jgi:Leucine-rich repeat (LRR) protein
MRFTTFIFDLIISGISAHFPGQDIREIETLNFSNRNYTAIDDITICEKLKKLDLSQNQLEGIRGALSFAYYLLSRILIAVGISLVDSLKWLNLSHNRLTSLHGLNRLNQLGGILLSNILSLCFH